MYFVNAPRIWNGCRPWKDSVEILSGFEPAPVSGERKCLTSPWNTASELGRLWSSHGGLSWSSSSSSSSSTLSEVVCGPVSAAELESSCEWKHLSGCPRRRSSSLDLHWAEGPLSADGESARCRWDLDARCFLRNLARRFLNQTYRS